MAGPDATLTPNPREFAPALTQPKVDFDPAAAPRASMHFDGLDYAVRGSDGAAVGNNPNSTIQAGGAINYRLFADHPFGAFGGIVVPGILTRFRHNNAEGTPTPGVECINPNATQKAQLEAGTLRGLGGGDADTRSAETR